MISKQRISLWGSGLFGVLILWGGLLCSVDLVEVVFVYQRVGGLSSYDRVFLAPVNIFS